MANKVSTVLMSIGIILVILHTCFHAGEGLEGNLFHLTFMNISTDKYGQQDNLQEIFISTDELTPCKVKIQYNSPLNFTEIVSLNSTNGFKYSRTITPTELAPQMNAKVKVAIVVSASAPVSVQANKAETGTGDGYLALPLTAQSKKFFLASYSYFQPMLTSFSIVSPFNDTCLSLSYVNGSAGYRIMHLTMQENEVYHGGSLDFDYTGVYISSSKPIAVYSGHSCAMVPVKTLYCDHLIEQMPPLSQWGKSFIVSSFWGRPFAVGFRLRVVAPSRINVTYTYQILNANNNPSTWTVYRTVSLDKGQWDEVAFEKLATTSPIAVMIDCSDNCLPMQYDTGFQVLGADGPGENALPDPFMVTALPLDHYQNNVRFSTSRHFKNNASYECVNGITIIAKKAEINQIYLDGKPINNIGGTLYNISVPGWSDYAVVIAPLTPGFHAVTSLSASVLYAVYVYGYGTQDHTGYGYLGGYRYLYGANDQPLNATYPLFDFTLPSEVATQKPPPTTPAPSNSPTAVSDADNAYYVLRFTGRYYAFNLEGNLITKFCSDGYARYFREKRLEGMKTKVSQYILNNCVSPDGSIGFSIASFIYSEYTAGVIEITVKVGGKENSRLLDIITCVKNSGLLNYFENLANWVDRYNNSREVLKNDTDYTKDCNVVHFLPEKFITTGLGWACPGGTQAVYSSASTFGIASLTSPLLVLLMHWSFIRLQQIVSYN